MVSRRKASIKNASVALSSQVIRMVGQFIVQTIFIQTLGAKYLGANGLFSNLVTFLSFAELGIGAAFSYALYAPLAKKDEKLISAIMDLYRKVYNSIGIGILILGLGISYFVPSLTNSSSQLEHIRGYFILYLLSTVVSYFFTYNRSLLIANQMGYIDSKNQMIFSVFRYIFQVLFLIYFNSYLGYLIVQILSNLLSNLAITRLANKQYPFLKTTKKEKLDPQVLKTIKKNVIGTVSSKIGSIVVTGTDNILISKFVSLAAVGLYSNYSLITAGVTTILNQVFTAVIASFGNLGVTERKNIKKQLVLFDQFVYVNAFFALFVSLFLFGIFQPFVNLWVGSKYMLSYSTVILIVVNFFLALFRPALYLVNAYGLFWGYRYKSIVEAVVNFGLSFILVKCTSMGIDGVLLGTIVGNILVNSWWDPMILFTGAYHQNISEFYMKYWAYLALFSSVLFAEYTFNTRTNIDINNIFELIIYAILLGLILVIVLLITLSRTTGQRYFIERFKMVIKK
ncbi:lipopolysaccharide biosynthesis protein [Latilactobacillus curvatus]|uniref:lipopolysaccharide biosynthesis protein n=1 Tax=Latilactobacillus curvatus TaxID=28038 RepID=UPI003CEA9938